MTGASGSTSLTGQARLTTRFPLERQFPSAPPQPPRSGARLHSVTSHPEADGDSTPFPPGPPRAPVRRDRSGGRSRGALLAAQPFDPRLAPPAGRPDLELLLARR